MTSPMVASEPDVSNVSKGAAKRRPSRPSPELRTQRETAVQPLFGELKSQGRSQTWLARQLGVSVRLINHYAHGNNRMPDQLLTQACTLIGFDRAWLETRSPLLRANPDLVVFTPKEPKNATKNTKERI